MEFFIIDVSDRNESSDLVRALQRRFISEEKEEEETNKNKNSHNKSLYYVRMDLSEVLLLLRNRNSPSSTSSTFHKRYPRTKISDFEAIDIRLAARQTCCTSCRTSLQFRLFSM